MNEREIAADIREKTRRLSVAASGSVISALWNRETGAITYTDELELTEKLIHRGYTVVCTYADGLEMIVLWRCSAGVVHMSMKLYEKIRSM